MEEQVVEGEYTGRVLQLEKEVHHIGSEVHKQSAAIGELRAGLHAHGTRLDKIGDGVEKLIDQKVNNPIFSPSFSLTVIAAVFALFFGIAQYTQMQNESQNVVIQTALDHVARLEAHTSKKLDQFEDFRTVTHYEVAQFRAFKDTMKEHRAEDKAYDRHHDDMFHDLQEKVNRLAEQGRSDNTSIKAIGDYVKEHTASTHSSDG